MASFAGLHTIRLLFEICVRRNKISFGGMSPISASQRPYRKPLGWLGACLTKVSSLELGDDVKNMFLFEPD